LATLETIETHRMTSGSEDCVQATFTLRGKLSND
jgi:hypothetical protein